MAFNSIVEAVRDEGGSQTVVSWLALNPLKGAPLCLFWHLETLEVVLPSIIPLCPVMGCSGAILRL